MVSEIFRHLFLISFSQYLTTFPSPNLREQRARPQLAGLFVFLEVRGPSVDTGLVLHFFTLELIAAAVGTVLPRLLEALRESRVLAEDVQDLEALVKEARRDD